MGRIFAYTANMWLQHMMGTLSHLQTRHPSKHDIAVKARSNSRKEIREM